ncbi:hypothetical protein [Sphingopyxis fribergensis]
MLEAFGLILGSFIVAIGLSAAGWIVFSRARHPEWGEPAIVLALALAIATDLIGGQFLSMVTILMAIAIPFLWAEGRRSISSRDKTRGRRQQQ